jgi:hypothetical protein
MFLCEFLSSLWERRAQTSRITHRRTDEQSLALGWFQRDFKAAALDRSEIYFHVFRKIVCNFKECCHFNNTVYGDATTFSPVEVHRRFGGMYYFQLQGRKPCLIQATSKNHRGSACFLLISWLTLRPWRWRQCFSVKHQWTSTWEHGDTSENVLLIHSRENLKSNINFRCH